MKEVGLRGFFDTVEDMVLIINREGRVLYSNSAVLKKLGYTLDELMKVHFFAICPPYQKDEVYQVFSDMFAGKRESSSLPLVRKDGTFIPTKTRVWLGKWSDSQCLFAIIRDLSMEQEVINAVSATCEKVLKKSTSAQVVKRDISYQIDPDKKEQDKPRALIVDDQLFNIKLLESVLKDEYIVMTATNGKEAIELATSEDQPDIILLDVIMPEMDGYEVCIRLREMPETRDIPVILLTSLKSEKNEEYALQLGVVDYITKPFSIPIVKARVKNHVEQKRYRDRQKECSYLDELTQIANRRKFNETIAIEWDRAKRNGSYLSMLLVDVDLFKKYNDFYGHLEGDKCLYKIAQTLKLNVKRSSDLVARWGGEEFACILTDTDHNGAILVGERLRKAIEKLEILNEEGVDKVVTVSIGVATVLPSEDNSLEELLEMADSALYKAKQAGRNRVCCL